MFPTKEALIACCAESDGLKPGGAQYEMGAQPAGKGPQQKPA